jgi:HlyD family secretion protein
MRVGGNSDISRQLGNLYYEFTVPAANMKKSARIVVALVILGVVAGAFYWYKYVRPTKNSGVLKVSGNIETTEVEMSFKIPGRVEKRFVDEGEMVEKGRPIAELEDADLQQDVAQRTAELAAAKSLLDELREGSRKQEIEAAEAAMQKAKFTMDDMQAGPRAQELASAEAEVRAATAERDRADAAFKRAQELVGGGAVSKDQYDLTKSTFEVATQRLHDADEKSKLLKAGYRENQIKAAEAAYQQAKWQYDMIKEGPRRQEIEQADAKVHQIKAALKLAETRLGYAKIVAPMTGMVLSKNIEPGEYVAAGTPIVTVGDLVNVWVRAYIPEELNGRVKFGQKVHVTTDNGKTYEGTVAFISHEAEFTPKNVQTEKERVKLVYRIKINITNPAMDLNPGVPVDGFIETGK